MPAPPHGSPASSRKRSKLAAPHDTGPRPTLPERPVGHPGRHRADVPGGPVADEGDHEGGDDDSEHAGAHERRHAEQRRLAAGEREEEDGDDWEGEVEELVPEAGQRHRARDRAGRGNPSRAALRTIRPCPRRGRQETIDSAVDAWVTWSARTKESPGSATCHGGANVRMLIAATTSSATAHGHGTSWRRPRRRGSRRSSAGSRRRWRRPAAGRRRRARSGGASGRSPLGSPRAPRPQQPRGEACP